MKTLGPINHVLALGETLLARLQGKGWGTGTLKREFTAAMSLLPSKNLGLAIDIGGNRGGMQKTSSENFRNVNW